MGKIYDRFERRKLENYYRVLTSFQSGDKDCAMGLLDKIEDSLLFEIKAIEDEDKKDISDEEIDISILKKNPLYKDEKLELILPDKIFKEKLLYLKEFYSVYPKAFEFEDYKEITWNNFLGDECLYYFIIDTTSRDFVGYLGIKNIHKKLWEIAMELLPEYCNKGYGYIAITNFMREISIFSNRNTFMTRVESDNIASQRLMKKVGFKPYSLSEFMFHSKEDMEKFEEENLDLIDDNIREVAKTFNVPERMLLSHVLEYRIDIKKEG